MQSRFLSESGGTAGLEDQRPPDQDSRIAQIYTARSNPYLYARQYQLPKRPQRVLILSDDLKFCALVRSYLRDCNLSVFACTTSRRAEATFLNRCEIDLWVLDMQALGREALRLAVRVGELNLEAPILIVEGYKSGERVATSVMREGWRTVKKSIELTGVLTEIHGLLGREGAAVGDPA